MFSIIQRLTSRPQPSAPPQARSRDERLRAAFAAAPVGLGVAGFDGRWVLFNDAAASVLGYTREDLGRVSLHDLTHPDDVKRELDFLRRMAAGDIRRYQVEKRVRDKAGAERVVVVTAALVQGRGAGEDFVVYVIEPRQARADSGRAADQLNHAILDHLPETAVIRCDAHGTILGWNRGAARMFGYTRDDIVGQNRRVLYREGHEGTEAAKEHLRECAEVRSFEAEDWRVDCEGRELWVHVSLTPFAPDGSVRGFVEVLHEATSRREAAMAAELREELQRERIAAATMENVVERLKARVQAEASRVAELERELSALRERPTTLETQPCVAVGEAEFVASRTGTRYHRPACNSMLRVKTRDRMPVISPLAGAQQGLSPCRNCVVTV
jgi:PAS domain S-box-containing protein